MKIINTHTGKIYVDHEHKLEFLTVGDYGKENNIKAEFLGLNKEINGVENTEVYLTEKWVATISTQKGCPMKCQFCDCPKFGFYGNATEKEMCFEIETILKGGCKIITSMHGYSIEEALQKKEELMSLFEIAILLDKSNGKPEVKKCIKLWE